MKTLINTSLLLLIVNLKFVNAQSITISPNNGSSIIESSGNNKAIKLPTVSATTAIVSPQKGMVVFDDASGTMSYFNGSMWVPLSNSSTGWAANGTNINSTNSGNVGIGNSSPNAKLHVKMGSSGASVPAFTNSVFENATNNVISILSPDNTQSGVIMQRPGSSGGVVYNTDESLGLIANNSTKMNIEANGNIGIGTASPASKVHVVNGSSGQVPNTTADLTVEDDATALIQMLSPQNNESGISFGLPSNLASGGIMYNNGGQKALQFRTRNNITQMTVDSLGAINLRTGKIESDNHILTIREGQLNSNHLNGFNIVPVSAGQLIIETDGTYSIELSSSNFVGELIPRIDFQTGNTIGLLFLNVVGTPNVNRNKLVICSVGYSANAFSKVVSTHHVVSPTAQITLEFERGINPFLMGDIRVNYVIYAF